MQKNEKRTERARNAKDNRKQITGKSKETQNTFTQISKHAANKHEQTAWNAHGMKMGDEIDTGFCYRQ